MAATADRKDPYRGYKFLIELGGNIRAGFREASGLDASQDPIEYREGDQSLTVRKLPGLNKYANVTLKRGVTDDVDLCEWRKKCIDGTVERRPFSIVLLDDTATEKARWEFAEGWPTKWTGPSFNATANEVAIETLEIAHEGFVKK